MSKLDRRDILRLGLFSTLGSLPTKPAHAATDLHRWILDVAAEFDARRRARFAQVRTGEELQTLQHELRNGFLDLLNGLSGRRDSPAARMLGRHECDDYVIDKIALESLPEYWVPALIYKPKTIRQRVAAILSPCGHSAVGKAAAAYQIFHIKLVKQGHVVLTYDPVGQGERSQFWDPAKQRSRFNLVCGEHCVLGNPLYLLGTSLAKYRIWDGIRAIDYLTDQSFVDAHRIGCAGNSGGGTLTAYISALDDRVRAAMISCYITSLPDRMANRIAKDPDSDPEQDIDQFVSRGIDHAGLLALLAPRPTLVCAAELDFFPIEGTRRTFAEAKTLYEVVNCGERLQKIEARERHGLSKPLRRAGYRWFARWLGPEIPTSETEEIDVAPRDPADLRVCHDGQVNQSLRSRHLLPLALDEFQQRNIAPSKHGATRQTLRTLLRLDSEQATFYADRVSPTSHQTRTTLLLINGTETRMWQDDKRMLETLASPDLAISIIDPRGVGRLRPSFPATSLAFEDPLSGIEENLAYNAFLVGMTLVGMRVADVLASVDQLAVAEKPTSIALCGRRDAALVACFAAALDERITHVAVDEAMLSFLPLFDPVGITINAASVVPGLLREFGDMTDVLRLIGPRKVLATAPRHQPANLPNNVRVTQARLRDNPGALIEWLPT